MAEHLCPGEDRPALVICSRPGSHARRLHHELGSRTANFDRSPSAVAATHCASEPTHDRKQARHA
ncbi:hypothetical protein [Streptomyces sp. NPDC048577]|uniref:hypothetical protein n=1 Tax=Streptomyces sp. NPDC048577 TaxID=3157209 RepID=UPI0034124B2A